MTILGLDLSLSGTGICVSTTDERFEVPDFSPNHVSIWNSPPTPSHFIWRITTSPKIPILDRWEDILLPILSCAQHCHQVVIEGYAFGVNYGTSRQLAELGGIVRYHLGKLGFVPLEVPPSVLKKFITGKGGADKNLVLKEIFKRYGADFNDDNMADAFALTKIGEAMLSTEGLPQFQVDVIEAIKKPKPKPRTKGK